MRGLLPAALILLSVASSTGAETILPRQALNLRPNSRTFLTAKAAVNAKTASLRLTIRRPRTISNGMTWNDNTKIRVTMRLTIDGVDYECTGSATGGVRSKSGGPEVDYSLGWTPPWGFFGAKGGPTKRLGETGSVYRVQVLIEHLSGSNMATEIEVSSVVADAPAAAFHNSVAFDTASSANENEGDGVIGVSHTAGGSDRAAWVTAGNADDTGSSSATATYAGNSITELFELLTAQWLHAGYVAVDSEMGSGAQTVEVTFLSGGNHVATFGVMSMTGVNQTTPTGSLVTDAGTGTAVSATVGSVGSDDLVVDSLISDHNEGADGWEVSVGANQTERVNDYASFDVQALNHSTQAGSDGGVMTWDYSTGTPTFAYSGGWALQAVAFKPVATAGPPMLTLMGVGD